MLQGQTPFNFILTLRSKTVKELLKLWLAVVRVDFLCTFALNNGVRLNFQVMREYVKRYLVVDSHTEFTVDWHHFKDRASAICKDLNASSEDNSRYYVTAEY